LFILFVLFCFFCDRQSLSSQLVASGVPQSVVDTLVKS
jgi:hypothetical protein